MSIENEKSKRTAAPGKLQSRPKTGDRKNSNGAAKTEDILPKRLAEIPHYMRPCAGSCHDACKREYQTAPDIHGRAASRIIDGGSCQNVSNSGGKGKSGGAKSLSGSRSCPAKIGRSFGTPKAAPSANSRKLRCEACKHRQQASVEATASPRTPTPSQRSVAVRSEPYSRRREDEDSADCEVKCEVKLSDANCEVKSEVKLTEGKLELPALLAPGGIDSDADETKKEFKTDCTSDAKEVLKIGYISDEAKKDFKVDCIFDEANKDFKVDCISDKAKRECKIDCASDEIKRKFKRGGKGDRHFGDENRKTENVVLKHRDVAGRKASEDWMVDHVVEEAVNKLARREESKVKAVVGAFESVISYTVQ